MSEINTGAILNFHHDELSSKKAISSDQFLGQRIPIAVAPTAFTFPNSEIKYGLQAISKWSKAAGGKETGGVLYIDLSGKTRFRDIAIGGPLEVRFSSMDFSDKTPERARETLSHMALEDDEDPTFILVPDGFSGSVRGHPVVESGKQLLGHVHVHQTGHLPGNDDFANFVYFEEPTSSIVAGENLYMLVKTQETPQLEYNYNEASGYSQNIYNEVEGLKGTGIADSEAKMQVLIKHCKEKNILFYVGEIAENEFTRVA